MIGVYDYPVRVDMDGIQDSDIDFEDTHCLKSVEAGFLILETVSHHLQHHKPKLYVL